MLRKFNLYTLTTEYPQGETTVTSNINKDAPALLARIGARPSTALQHMPQDLIEDMLEAMKADWTTTAWCMPEGHLYYNALIATKTGEAQFLGGWVVNNRDPKHAHTMLIYREDQAEEFLGGMVDINHRRLQKLSAEIARENVNGKLFIGGICAMLAALFGIMVAGVYGVFLNPLTGFGIIAIVTSSWLIYFSFRIKPLIQRDTQRVSKELIKVSRHTIMAT